MKAELANAVIRAMSDWIDEGKEHLAPSHLVRIRTGKLMEEQFINQFGGSDV